MKKTHKGGVGSSRAAPPASIQHAKGHTSTSVLWPRGSRPKQAGFAGILNGRGGAGLWGNELQGKRVGTHPLLPRKRPTCQGANTTSVLWHKSGNSRTVSPHVNGDNAASANSLAPLSNTRIQTHRRLEWELTFFSPAPVQYATHHTPRQHLGPDECVQIKRMAK